MDKRTSNSIYAVRGIGAILIMVYHYSVHYSNLVQPLQFKYFDFAYLTFAVPLFFLFSAYFLYGKTIKYCSPVKLVFYRMTRLYPMYWLAVLFSSTVIVLIGHEKLSFKSILLNLTMVEKVFGIEHIDGAYWTMFYELMLLFILAAATLLILKNNRVKHKTQLVCAIWIALGAISSGGMKLLNIDSSTIAVLLFACRYVPVFVMGILLYNRYQEDDKISDKTFYIFYVCSLLYELLLGQNIYHGIYGIVAILIGHAAISGRFARIKLFKATPLVFLGKISYNIYLTHNQFGRILIGKMGGYCESMLFLSCY